MNRRGCSVEALKGGQRKQQWPFFFNGQAMEVALGHHSCGARVPPTRPGGARVPPAPRLGTNASLQFFLFLLLRVNLRDLAILSHPYMHFMM